MFYENPNRSAYRLPAFSKKARLWGKSLGLLTLIYLWGWMPLPMTWAPIAWAKTPVKSQPPAAIEQALPIGATLAIGNEILELEVAKTPQQQEIGLMNRRSLAANRGMIFLFSPPRVTLFWMKNTLIPLDIIFLSQNKVIAIYHNVQPCKKNPCPTYGPLTAIDRVIELSGGRAKTLGLQIGDSLEVKFKPTSP
jgi:uncharacterized membrane protein (UPF0127 family)